MLLNPNLRCKRNPSTGLKEVLVRGPWKPQYAKFVRRKGLALYLNDCLGSQFESLDFLEDLPNLRSLRVIGVLHDNRGAEVCEQLEHLSLNTSSQKLVDYTRFPKLKSLFTYGLGKSQSVLTCTSLEDLYVYGYGNADFTGMSELTALRKLHIGPSRNLISTSGVERLQNLRMLSLAYASNLTEFAPIGTLAHLQRLEIQNCRHIADIEFVRFLNDLEWLTLAECKDVASLLPLEDLPKLKKLVAYGSTKILDGDMSILGRLPDLKEAYLQQRRSYTGMPERFLQR